MIKHSYIGRHALTAILVFGVAAAPRAFAEWVAVTADSAGGSVGQYASLAVVNGYPAISHWDQTNHDLRFVRATDATGSAWGTTVPVESGPTSVGKYTSLAVVNGNPAIAYYDIGNTNLKYVRATDADGTSWATPIDLDASADSVGTYASLAVVDGNPAIAYYDATNRVPRYIRATDANGTAWGSPLTVEVSADRIGEFTSLAVVNGNPAIAYMDRTNTNVRYVRATDAAGTAWGTPVAIDVGAAAVGEDISLTMVNGRPAIAYKDLTTTNLRFVRAGDANGAAWGTPLPLDVSTSNVGQFASLAVIGGNPAIAYWDATDTNPRYIAATDPDGVAWGAPVAIDVGATNMGQFTSLAALANGNPAIAYFDGTDGGARFATLAPGCGRACGDFDLTGCTDLADFLFLLDNWQLDVDGTMVGLSDFLNLLDNWQLGPAC